MCDCCSAQFFGRQQFLHCALCARRFHCKCLDIKAEENDIFMQSGKSSYKCRDCSRRTDPSTTRLIGAKSDGGATPTAGYTESDIDERDNSEAVLSGASSEIVSLLVRLSSRLEILTAEVKLLRADNTALRVEVSQLRQAVLNETIAAASKDASPVAPERMAHSYASDVQGARSKEWKARCCNHRYVLLQS